MSWKSGALLLACALWQVQSYPAYYPYYSPSVDAISFGSNDDSQNAATYSRYYQPYYNTRSFGGGMAAFMFQPQPARQNPTNQGYYLPDRRRQTTPDTFIPPQQNEVFYPQTPDKILPIATTEASDIPESTVRVDLATTAKASIVPELTNPEEEIEEVTQKPRRKVSKKRPVKEPVEDDEEDFVPRMPAGAYFPMFFGYGGRSGGGGPGGATAVANAYSTGRGGVASSHATAYGVPRPEEEPSQP